MLGAAAGKPWWVLRPVSGPAGLLSSPLPDLACSAESSTLRPLFAPRAQGGKQHTAADLVRRLKAQHVQDEDAQEAGRDDPEAFDWCVAARQLTWLLLGQPCHACAAYGCFLSSMPTGFSLRFFPTAFFRRAGLGQLPAVAALFRGVPIVHHMLGPMDAQPRQKRAIVRQARRKEPLGEGRPGACCLLNGLLVGKPCCALHATPLPLPSSHSQRPRPHSPVCARRGGAA